MRFMMLMIPLGYETAPPDTQLDPERVAAMMKYNEALKDAGILITLDGLHPPSMGARVSFATGKPVVTDGPFAEAKEVLGGYWMIEVASRDEAIAWARKCPASENEIIEIRQVQEMTDFPEEVQQAAAGFAELREGVNPCERPFPEYAASDLYRRLM
ncbi:YciI family protein [Bradyrhizobium sediminis]|uniref:YciI family protein n=1 Tax=Bradyrhizobium sediminis TaxID=2840469 RepID=A0A975RYB2_9BRAD|nr:YciI family protein [Bradyrhizobium sediminis]QWG24254.1 YciI family protein [Bradyrhizobium sediminis]